MDLEAIDGKEIQDLSPETREVLELDRVSVEHLQDRLEGRDGGLRTSKPRAKADTGLEQYVWRMARFHSGADPRMPVTAGFDLDNFLENQGIDASVSGIRDETGKEIEALLGRVVPQVIVANLGGNPAGGFERWEKAIYG
jgi:hypothetical protein